MRDYKFNAVEVRNAVVAWIKSQAEYTKFDKVVIGISGGKDSTIVAALCCRALGAENVHGIIMPNGLQSDFDDAVEVCNVLGIKYDVINIKPMYDAFVMQYNMCTMHSEKKDENKKANDVNELIENMTGRTICDTPSEDALINLAPRIRMTVLRMWGQTNHHRLVGTSNFSEITVGYCTKDGDTCHDIAPIAKLSSIEVVQIGDTMEELPKHLVHKVPNDGLSGVPDEEKIGVTYDEIHRYIRNLTLERETWYKIRDMEYAALHKRSNNYFNIPDKYIYTEDN